MVRRLSARGTAGPVMATLIFAACASSDPAAATPTPLPASPPSGVEEQWLVVFAEADPEAWPWTVDAATLRCEPGNEVVAEFEDGRRFTINAPEGSARWEASNELLREGKTPGDLSEMIERGSGLCA